MAHADAAIVLDGVAVALAGRRIWGGASFDLGRGEVVAVIGANGSGKSSLLRLLLGQLPPAAGRVTVMGAPPRRGNRAVGLVPQRHDLGTDLAVRGRDLVLLGINGHRWGFGRPHRAELEQAERALAAVGALDYADDPVGALSGGQQQRLFIAQALVDDLQVLLLDEPLASLDLRSQGEIVGVVADINRTRKATTLVVTHDLNPLLSIVHQVLYILDGCPHCGRVEDVVNADLLSALYDTPVRVVRGPQGELFVRGA